MTGNNELCSHCDGGIGLKYPLFITEKFWIVCDAHPLIEGHILIIPKEHISCMGALDEESFDEYEQLYKKTLSFLQKTYGDIGIFEHGITGQTVFHAHTHFLPFKKSIEEDIVPEKQSIWKINELKDVKKEFEKTGKYMYVALNDVKWRVDTKIGFPRFFRERFANALEVSERANWKKTRENPELMKIFEVDTANLKNKWNDFFDMKDIYERIWNLAMPYLKKGVMKDFVIHTQGVVKAMELILNDEKGDEDILIPAAILHDVGWSKVPADLQKSKDDADRKKALQLHLNYASPIIEEVLTKVNYSSNQIQRVVKIVEAHKFQDPDELEKQLLIDADGLSDTFKEQFYSDVKSYRTTPEKLYDFRKQNKFYTQTARKIFNNDLEERRGEFKASD